MFGIKHITIAAIAVECQCAIVSRGRAAEHACIAAKRHVGYNRTIRTLNVSRAIAGIGVAATSASQHITIGK